MALTYPRDLPTTVKFTIAQFDLRHQQLAELAAGGVPQVVNVGADLWRVTYRTTPLIESVGEGMAAWLSSLRGGAKLFRATNPLRRYTISRRQGYSGLVRAGTSTAFSGTATITSITTLRDGLSLSGLPAAFVLLPGDWLSIPVSASRVSLHRITEGATANGAGLAAISVEPAILPDATVGGSVDLASPGMLAVLDETSLRHTVTRGRFHTFDFQAQQVLG